MAKDVDFGNDVADANEVCLAARYGKHRIVARDASNFVFAKQMHHIAAGDASLKYNTSCDIIEIKPQ